MCGSCSTNRLCSSVRSVSGGVALAILSRASLLYFIWLM